MIWFVFLGLTIGAASVVLAIARYFKNSEDPANQRLAKRVKVWGLVAVLALLFALPTVLRSVKQVPAGYVGVVYTFSDITGQTESGLQIVAPWKSVKTASVQIQKHTFKEIEAFSQETQDVFIKATVNYQVSPRAIQKLYRDVGHNWFHRLVESRVLQIFKDVTVRYSSVDIAPNREQIRTAVRERLRRELEPYSVEVVDLLVDNVDFRKEFKQAIESKQIATQEALREEELVAKKEFEAQQRIKEAQGKAEAIRIEAAGQADANRLLSQSLTPLVIQFEALKKLGDNVQIVLIPSGQGVIIDPTTLLGQANK